jgi:hypothetical protein
MIVGDSRPRFRPEQGFWLSERRVEVASPLRPGCGLVAGPPCPAISGHRGCVLKRPGMAAHARTRIRMIMAGLARRGVVGGVGVAARIDGVVACRGAACL